MRVERKKVITIMKYIEENPNFYFPFKIICKDFKENSDYYETDCLEEIDYKFIENNKDLINFQLEENLQDLEAIVTKLENGDVVLEDAIAEFQKGMKISETLKKTLNEAEETLVKIVGKNDQESDFSPEQKDY